MSKWRKPDGVAEQGKHVEYKQRNLNIFTNGLNYMYMCSSDCPSTLHQARPQEGTLFLTMEAPLVGIAHVLRWFWFTYEYKMLGTVVAYASMVA